MSNLIVRQNERSRNKREIYSQNTYLQPQAADNKGLPIVVQHQQIERGEA